jgi:cysteine-rich repeat protein
MVKNMLKNKKIVISLVLVVGFAALLLSQVKAEQAPPAPVCGNGKLESGEECDDSNTAAYDGCSQQCLKEIIGWGWMDSFGWLSLHKLSCSYLDPSVPSGICNPQNIGYGIQIDKDNNLFGFAWSDNIGWVCFGQSCGDPAGHPARLEPDGTDAPPVIGWAQIMSLGNNGWISLSCQNDSPACTASHYQIKLVLSDFNGTQWPTLAGWGWNGNQDGTGLGWVNFNPDLSGLLSWLQTKYGDIYSRKGVTSERPAPDYNATYQILSGGDITNFQSARYDVNQGRFTTPINFPTPENRYSNVLGRLDLKALICTFATGSDTCINQNGKTVVNLNSVPLQSQQLLGGKVYYARGDLTISTPITFKNGTNFENGSGTIIIDGDLTIKADIAYDTSNNLSKFRNLSSVAWIVKGDLKIDPNVKNLAGNFIIIGNGQSCDDRPEIEVASCGQVYSCGSRANCTTDRLTVSGLMMARKFYFMRILNDSYKNESPKQGSELIIYDGRLLANIPPGLGDFATALPVWRSGSLAQ